MNKTEFYFCLFGFLSEIALLILISIGDKAIYNINLYFGTLHIMDIIYAVLGILMLLGIATCIKDAFARFDTQKALGWLILLIVMSVIFFPKYFFEYAGKPRGRVKTPTELM